MTGSSDSNRSESQGGNREGLSTKEGRSKDNDRRNTNRQRGRMRAMSVLGNAKSNRHRKTHQVEPDGPESNRFMHLTRGGLPCENRGEVSRGRSSEESRGNTEGAKGRRTTERATKPRLRQDGVELAETREERQQRQLPPRANVESADGLPRKKRERPTSRRTRERRKERAQ